MPAVLIVDDQELVRAGFRLILERAGIEVRAEAGDGVEALAAARDTRPDVVLMDVRMPRMDGIEATRHVLDTVPHARVLALTTFDLDEYVYRAIRAGACGFLLKNVTPGELVRCVQACAAGDAVLSPTLIRRLLTRFAAAPEPGVLPTRFAELAARELDVLRLVAAALTNAEIGERLFLSEATVKTYVSRLLTKLALRDRVQLAVLAYESGLVRPGEPTQSR